MSSVLTAFTAHIDVEVTRPWNGVPLGRHSICLDLERDVVINSSSVLTTHTFFGKVRGPNPLTIVQSRHHPMRGSLPECIATLWVADGHILGPSNLLEVALGRPGDPETVVDTRSYKIVSMRLS